MSPILFNLHGEYLTKGDLKGFADFKTGGQILCNVKCADSLVLMAKEEMMLQGTTERLINVRRFNGMEINVKKWRNEKLKAAVPNPDYYR